MAELEVLLADPTLGRLLDLACAVAGGAPIALTDTEGRLLAGAPVPAEASALPVQVDGQDDRARGLRPGDARGPGGPRRRLARGGDHRRSGPRQPGPRSARAGDRSPDPALAPPASLPRRPGLAVRGRLRAGARGRRRPVRRLQAARGRGQAGPPHRRRDRQGCAGRVADGRHQGPAARCRRQRHRAGRRPGPRQPDPRHRAAQRKVRDRRDGRGRRPIGRGPARDRGPRAPARHPRRRARRGDARGRPHPGRVRGSGARPVRLPHPTRRVHRALHRRDHRRAGTPTGRSTANPGYGRSCPGSRGRPPTTCGEPWSRTSAPSGPGPTPTTT